VPEPVAAAAGAIGFGDLEVRRMGFGARWVTHGPEGPWPLLRRMLELGVNLIDTADVYGPSEGAIAEVLHPYPDDLVIATKGGQAVVDDQPTPIGTPEHLRAACEESIRRLRVDAIDLYQLHSPDPNVPLEESLGALQDLRNDGLVREIGVSNFYGDYLDLALSGFPIVSVQNEYSLTRRPSERELRTCEANGVAFMPWCPLAGGALAQAEGVLAEIAATHGATPAQVALAWLLGHSPAMVPIPGTSSVEHLEANVTAAELRLTDADLERLEALEAS
jgi:pyridoxine 4-dehydrogenase